MPCTVSMRALCSALMGRQTRICLDIIGSPSLFLSIIPQTARQYKGRFCCFQPHPIKEQCRTAQKLPGITFFQSSARIASTVRLYCSATFANCSCVPSNCPARRVSVRV